MVGAGISKPFSGSTLMSLNYDHKLGGRDVTAHQVNGRLRHTF
jgi:hypothetical protein